MNRAVKSLIVLFGFLAILTLSRHAIGSHPSSTTPITSTTSVTSSSSVSTTPAGGFACLASDFQGSFNQGQGAAGTVYDSVTLTKVTSGSCSIKGWPMLALQDRTGAIIPSSVIDLPTSNSPIQFPAAQANVAPTKLTLSDGSLVTFSLAYSDVARGTEVCASATTLNVQLVKLGSTVDVTLAYPLQPCNSASIWVSPFY